MVMLLQSHMAGRPADANTFQTTHSDTVYFFGEWITFEW